MTYPPGPPPPDGSSARPGAYPPPAPPPPQTGPPAYNYGYGYQPPAALPGEIAGMGRRFSARLIDGLIVGLVFTALIVAWMVSIAVTGGFEPDQETPPLLFWIGLPVIYLVLPAGAALYEVLCIGLRGATIGKALLGVKVVDQQTFQAIGMGPAFLRWLIPFAAGFTCIGGPLVYLSPLFDNSGWRRGWHDSAAKDVVLFMH